MENILISDGDYNVLIRSMISLNKKREGHFLKIKSLIISCNNFKQVQTLEKIVDRFASTGGGDGKDLIDIYKRRVAQLNPDFGKNALPEVFEPWNRLFVTNL